MAVVPMFHVNAWGLPFAATWFGAKQVFPGPMFTPKLLAQFYSRGKGYGDSRSTYNLVRIIKGIRARNYDTSSLRGVLCGGSAAPKGD